MTIPNGSGDTTPSSNENDQDFEFSAEELEALDDKAKQAILTLGAQKKHWRTKAKENEAKIEALKNTPPPVVPPVITQPPVAADPEAVVRKIIIEDKLKESLASIPEDKRASVTEVYKSLTAGKPVDSATFQSYFGMALNALGVQGRTTSSHQITTGANGAIPPKTPPGPSAEDIEMAKKAGNDPAKVYGPDASMEGLHNAERFIAKNEEEFN